jgi:hypothetical protein
MFIETVGGVCMSELTHPARASAHPHLYLTVLVFRAIWVIIATIAVQSLFPLGTDSVFVAVAGIIGVIISSWVAQSRINHLGFLAAVFATFVTYRTSIWGLQEIAGILGITTLTIDRFAMHVGTCMISATVWALVTWAFWRIKAALTLEVLGFFTVALLLFSGHRNFHLDRPKILNSIAWQLRVDHVTMLVIIGAALTALALIYFYCAALAVRPRIDGPVTRVIIKKTRVVSTLACVVLLAGILFSVQNLVYRHYNSTMLARVANGVGMNTNPGVSPLSFQSALGSTNQPAALVRLEGDYSNNPFSPMMYLRESALSSFNGKEMVFAGRAYDTDLPVTSTRESFSRQEDSALSEREPLVQSMYLIAEHDHAFAADYPISIKQLKNPRPNRFKATYRAHSVAPAYKISALSSREVGDARWTQDIKDHYLAQHPDIRYAELARSITKDATTPIEKLNAITAYLSKTAIYTLTPNHAIQPTDDPVAAFLFGDNRGYCVHFAHAIVFMARSLGIPSRIGTGYLTDLSQAKDGHILLRMSDRHAWAETHINGIGWVPFDVQPEKVESHAETQVDAKLLEELMGVLEPGEEILPPDATKDEAGMTEPEEYWIPSINQLMMVILSLVLSTVLVKLWLRYGWRYAPTSNLALRWGYISAASRLHDIGVSRRFGETRSEFASRAPNRMLDRISALLVTNAYKPDNTLIADDVKQAMRDVSSGFSKLPLRTRILAAINPGSVARTISGLFVGRDW